jgi:hypothetical protein
LAAFVPEHDLGFVILVNSEAPAYPRYAIMRRMIDLYKGFPDKDYNAMYYDEWLESSRKGQKAKDKKQAERELKPAPQLSSIVGEYNKDALFGGAVVALQKGVPYITIGPKGWKAFLEHDNGNVYTFRMDGNTFEVEFVFDGEAAAAGAKCIGLDVNFGYTENFGLWPKIK